jgi:hypothetical protein
MIKTTCHRTSQTKSWSSLTTHIYVCIYIHTLAHNYIYSMPLFFIHTHTHTKESHISNQVLVLHKQPTAECMHLTCTYQPNLHTSYQVLMFHQQQPRHATYAPNIHTNSNHATPHTHLTYTPTHLKPSLDLSTTATGSSVTATCELSRQQHVLWCPPFLPPFFASAFRAVRVHLILAYGLRSCLGAFLHVCIIALQQATSVSICLHAYMYMHTARTVIYIYIYIYIHIRMYCNMHALVQMRVYVCV